MNCSTQHVLRYDDSSEGGHDDDDGNDDNHRDDDDVEDYKVTYSAPHVPQYDYYDNDNVMTMVIMMIIMFIMLFAAPYMFLGMMIMIMMVVMTNKMTMMIDDYSAPHVPRYASSSHWAPAPASY